MMDKQHLQGVNFDRILQHLVFFTTSGLQFCKYIIICVFTLDSIYVTRWVHWWVLEEVSFFNDMKQIIIEVKPKLLLNVKKLY